jgi:hypothetical protein
MAATISATRASRAAYAAQASAFFSRVSGSVLT